MTEKYLRVTTHEAKRLEELLGWLRAYAKTGTVYEEFAQRMAGLLSELAKREFFVEDPSWTSRLRRSPEDLKIVTQALLELMTDDIEYEFSDDEWNHLEDILGKLDPEALAKIREEDSDEGLGYLQVENPPVNPRTQIEKNRARILNGNYVARLQEWCQAGKIKLPDYSYTMTGEPHAPEFTCRCVLLGEACEATGGNKKAAKQAVAKVMLDHVEGVSA